MTAAILAADRTATVILLSSVTVQDSIGKSRMHATGSSSSMVTDQQGTLLLTARVKSASRSGTGQLLVRSAAPLDKDTVEDEMIGCRCEGLVQRVVGCTHGTSGPGRRLPNCESRRAAVSAGNTSVQGVTEGCAEGLRDRPIMMVSGSSICTAGSKASTT